MPENGRIEELRQQLDKDPASTCFADLAEELQRAGRLQEAVQTCRLGLARNPGFLAARVTLGRCLMALNDLVSARAELEQVLRVAPSNPAGLEALHDVYGRLGLTAEAQECADRIEAVSGRTRTLRATVAAVMREPDPFAALAAAARPASTPPAAPVIPSPPPLRVAPAALAGPAPASVQAPSHARTVRALEQFLHAVHAARSRRGAA